MKVALAVLVAIVCALATRLTVVLCQRDAAEEQARIWRAVAWINGRRVRALEKMRPAPQTLQRASRMLRALSDLVRGG